MKWRWRAERQILPWAVELGEIGTSLTHCGSFSEGKEKEFGTRKTAMGNVYRIARGGGLLLLRISEPTGFSYY